MSGFFDPTGRARSPGDPSSPVVRRKKPRPRFIYTRTFREFEKLVAATGVDGTWHDRGATREFHASTDVVLVYRCAGASVTFRGPRNAREEFRSKCIAAYRAQVYERGGRRDPLSSGGAP